MTTQDRRIITEIKYLKEKYNDVNINIQNDIAEVIVQYPKESKYPKVKFLMKGNYPFHSPLVYVFVDGKETTYLKSTIYHNFPRIIQCIETLKKMGSTSIPGDCFCCNSILCDLWSPACLLEKVIDEIMQINYIKQQVKVLLGLNDIGKKYALPEDIERYIFEFLY